MPDARTVYRWHETLGADLIYFPNIALQSLGFVHVHVFSDVPVECDYAVRSLWVVRSPGSRSWYVHCVVPAGLATDLRTKLAKPGITMITTGDAWQVLGANDTPRPCPADAHDLLERYPLLIPAIFEGIESRQSYPALWDAIYDRLGSRVWEYLPRFSRRLPHNGKRYVSEAFRILTDAHLIRQHVIRYAPWQDTGIELFLMVRAGTDEVARAFPEAVAIEIYPTTEGSLAHVYAPLSCLNRIFTATLTLPITNVWYVDRLMNDEQPLRSRVAYERLFDPTTGTWVIE
jgi:hypothetical protein